MKYFFYLLLNLISLSSATANTCVWTGPANGDWNTPSNWNCNQVPGPLDFVLITNGSVTLNSNATVGSLVMDQISSIKGSGTLHIEGAFNLSAAGTYTFTTGINAKGLSAFENCTINVEAQTFSVAGGGSMNGGTLFMKNTGIFEIPSGAAFTVSNNLNIFGFLPFPSFVVKGALTKNGPGNMTFEAVYRFDHATIDLQTGFLINYLYEAPAYCTIHQSTVNMGAGASLRTARMIDIDSTVFTGGTLQVVTSSATLLTGNTMGCKVWVEDGILSGANGAILSSLKQTGGSINLSNLKVTGDYEWAGGSFMGSGTVEGQTMITDLTPATMMRFCVNLTAKGGGNCASNDKFQGTFTIAANSTFTFSGAGDTEIANLNINGTLRKNSGNKLLVSSFLLPAAGSVITGTGRLDPGIQYFGNGILAPGLPVGKLDVGPAEFFQQSSGKIEIDLLQNAGTTRWDTLAVSGKTHLKGTLKVSESGAVPNGMYTVLTATDSVLGAFATLDLPAGYSVVYQPFSVVLVKDLLLPPVAGFGSGSLSGCAPDTVHFENLSAGSIDVYQWSFPGGEPSVSSAPNPVVVYAAAGSFDVTLIVSNAAGADTLLQNAFIDVQNAPEPGFSWQPGAASGEIAFTNNSLNADTYLWDFGDGDQSDLADPVHIYVQNGSYPVTLTAANACGERVITDTVFVMISGLQGPKEAGIALRLYPNPGFGPVHIALDGPATPQIRIRILDATGVCISDREFDFSSGALRYEPGSDSWPAGVYFVQVLYRAQSYGMRVLRF